MDKQRVIEFLSDKNLSQNLMKDENFKKEAKDILKKDMPNITDEQLLSLLKDIQKGLQSDTKIESEEDFEKVFGGNKNFKQVAIESFCTIVGALGCGLSAGIGPSAIYYSLNKKDNPQMSIKDVVLNSPISTASIIPGVSATIFGGTVGNFIGKLICKKAGLKN